MVKKLLFQRLLKIMQVQLLQYFAIDRESLSARYFFT